MVIVVLATLKRVMNASDAVGQAIGRAIAMHEFMWMVGDYRVGEMWNPLACYDEFEKVQHLARLTFVIFRLHRFSKKIKKPL